MSEKEKTDFECLCEKFDKKIDMLMKIIYGLMTLILGGSLVLFVTFGEVKAQTKENTRKTEYIWKDYIPAMFLEGFVKNQNYQTQEIVATIKGDPEKIREINEKYIDFQKTMINNMILMKGGTANITRSGKSTSSTTEGGSR